MFSILFYIKSYKKNGCGTKILIWIFAVGDSGDLEIVNWNFTNRIQMAMIFIYVF